MPTSVVVSQITLANDRDAVRVKGTVGGTAFTTELKHFRFDPVSQPASVLAALLMSRYNLIVNKMADSTLGLNSRTVLIPVRDAKTSSIVYGSTPYAFVGYNIIEITATVDTVSTKIHVDQDLFLEWMSTGEDMGARMGKLLYNQAQRDVFNAANIATFSLS